MTDPSGIGIKLTGTAPIGYAATYVAGTVPADANGLRNGISRAVDSERVSFALTNLDPLKSYEIWVLGGNNTGTTQTQQVTVEGAQGIQSFTQTIPNLNVWVNSAAGDSTKAVTDFAPIFVQAPLHDDLDNNGTAETYAVRVAFVRSPELNLAQAAGIVIREYIPTYTLPASGGPFSLLVENGSRVVRSSGGALLATMPSTGAMIINGTAAASDVLNVNLSSGNPLAGGVTFHGGAGGNDGLIITGGNQGTATYNYTNANDGSVELSNFGTIAYTGLEPIANSGTATDAIFNLPAAMDVAFLEDNGATAGDGMLRLRSSPTTFELTDFAIPSGSLTVNLGAGNDTFTVTAVPQFSAALTINGGTGNDTINLNTSISFGSGRDLNIDLQDDDPAPGLDSIHVRTGVALNLTGSGAATMRTSRGIALAENSTIATTNGPIILAANQQATPSSGDFIGIDILGATVRSTTGDITLLGRGGTGSQDQVGVFIHGLGLVGDTTTGVVTINGRGGNTPAGSAGRNSGVVVIDVSRVSTEGSNIAITGTGGTDASNNGNNHGVVVDGSKVNVSGAGTLTIDGTGTGPGSFGIQVSVGGEALKTGSGKMTLNGTGETGVFTDFAEIVSAADIQITGTATTSVNPGIRHAGNLLAVGAGNIKLIADRIAIDQNIDAGFGSVAIVPKTAGRAIILGTDVNNTDDGPTQLGILDIEQSQIKAGTLNIGDANSGQISVIGTFARPAAAFATNINLTSGGLIRFNAGPGFLDSAGGNVTLNPGPAPAAASFAKTGTDLVLGPSVHGLGTLAFGADADASFAINGTAPDTGFQVLNVSGNVNLTGADLVLSGSHNPAFSATFAIVRYTGTRTGTFNNGTAMLNGQIMTVVYDDANRQVLVRAPDPPSLTATLSAGDLTITDTNAAGKINQLTVSATGGNLVITDANESFTSPPAGGTLSNGNRTLTIPLASVTGSLIVNSAGGNDLLTLDYTTGNISRPVIYNGGTQTGVPGDRLKLMGGAFTAVTHNFTSASGGTILLDGATVTYTGLEPVDMGGLGAANLIFNLPAAASSAILEDDGISGNGISQFRSTNTTFETTTFGNPTGSLTINRGNAADTLTVNSLPDFTSGLTIATEINPLAAVTVNGALTLAAGKNLSANSSGGIILGTTNSDVATSGDGSISLTAVRDIRLVAGSSITTVNGSLLLAANQQSIATTGNFKGIDVENATIQATGTGAVTLRGKGGDDSGGLQYGVRVRSSGLVKGGSGGLLVIGQGGGSVDSGLNVGVLVNTAGQLSAAGVGAVTVQGTGGTGSANSHLGVWINDAGSMITSSGGNVQITGQGGGVGASGFNLGVNISSSAQVSAGGIGSVTVQGTGGTGPGELNHGIYINGNAVVTSSGGNVQVTGQGGGSAAAGSNSGVFIDSGQITAGSNGTVTVMGAGGAGSGDGNNGVFITGTGSAITSSGGNVQVTGVGGGSGSSRFNDGVSVFSSGLISAGGSGSVVVQGTGGAGSGASNTGVSVSLSSALITSSGGNVQITGIEGAGSSGIAISASSGAISTPTNGGNLTLIGNSMSIGASATIGAGAANSVTLRPLTNGVLINLGQAANPVGGPLSLTDAEFDRITAGQIIIGDLNSGAVTFTAPISLANSDTLQIITGSTINDTGGITVFTDSNLALTASAGIGTTGPLNVAVASLAAAGGNLGVDISNTGNLAVTTLGGVIGATATNSNVTISTAGSLTVDQPIAATASGGIALTAIGDSLTANAAITAGTAGVTLIADAGIQLATTAADITTSGPIDLNADFNFDANGSFNSATGAKVEQTGTEIPVTITASDITLDGTIDSSGILILQPSTADRSIALHDNAGNFRLDAGEITRAGANGGGRYIIGRTGGTGQIQIGRSGLLQLPAGDFTIQGGDVFFNGPLLTAATAPTLEIISTGAIQQTFSGNAITNASSLLLDSAQGVGAPTNPIRVAAGQSLAARASVSGPVAIASTDSLTSRTVGGVSGISTNGGTISLEAFNFRVGLTGIGGGPINAGTGAVHIGASANAFVTSGGLTINDAITGGLDSTLQANSLFLNSTGSVNIGTAKLTIQPDSDLDIDLGGPDVSGVALGLTNDELDRIVGGTLVVGDIPFSGQITITAPINIADNATPIPTLHLASRGGIIDANAAGPDLTVANLALEAFSGADVSNRLTTQVVTLAASSVGAGDVLIDNLGPLTITIVDGRSGVSANGGIVELTADGSLTINSPIGATGGDIALTANGDDQLLTIAASVSGLANAVFTADKMRFGSPVNFGFGKLTLVPESIADSGDAIILAASSTAGPDTLAFTDDEFFISAGEIQIGDSQSGPTTIASDFTAFPANNFSLVSGGPINFVGGPLNTGGGNLTLTPGDPAGTSFAKAGTDVNVGPDNVLAFAPGSDLKIALDGTAVDTQYQQLNVVGQVDLTGVDFVPSLGFAPPPGTKFTIVANDGVDPIVGELNGLLDASLLILGSGPQSRLAQISYFGGDGNDVVLNVIDPTDPSLSGTSGDDRFLVRRVAGDVEILMNGASLLTTPFNTLTRIRLDSLAGNDTLTVDLTGGDPIPAGNIHFTGGAPTIAPGDSLIIAGGAQGTVTYNYTNANDGSVVMSAFGTITYTGLEPILNTGTATDVIFNLPAGTNNATLADDGTSGNVLSRLSGPTIETTDFTNPTGSLTINRGSASDSLTIGALPDFTAGLSIGSAAAPFTNVTISGGVNFAANKSFSAHASGSITLTTAASDLATSGTGSISLTAARNIAIADGSSLRVVNGNLTLSANQQDLPTTGDFIGVLIGNATVQSTGIGQVTILGRSGSSASGGQLFGVLVNAGGQILGGTSGVLQIDGIGGDSNGSVKSGVRLTNGAQATTAGADVLITGVGGQGGAFNRGVELFSGAVISAGGAGGVGVFGAGGLAPGNENQGVLVNGVGTTITSASGDVTIEGFGGGTGASIFNGGVVAVSSGSFGGGGAVQITGRAGNEETASNGVALLDVTSGGGNITITGIPVNAAAPSINLTGTIAPGPGGNVVLFADRLNIAASASISAPLQTVTILTNSENVAIDLGGADSEFTLGLSDAELDAITAEIIEIGDFFAGDIEITADITRPTFTNVSLASGGSIHFVNGSVSTSGGGLLLAPDPSAVVTVANDANDANLAPSGTLFFTSGADLLFNLDGPAPDTQYNQLHVAGSIDLTDVDLFLSVAFGLPAGSDFLIVNNDGVDPVIGRFNGLDDGQIFALTPDPDFPLFQISYFGGDGNDVVLTAIDPRNPEFTGTAGDDTFLVKRRDDALEVSLNGTLIFSYPFADVNFLLFDGLAGNDTLTVDLTAGDAVPDGAGISFIGGASTAGDNLSILGGNQGNVSYFYDEFPTGLVNMSSIGPINFLSLESILNTGTATEATINLFGPGGSFLLSDDFSSTNQLTQISGPGILLTDFSNPTNSLTINPGHPADSLTVSDLPNFSASLNIGSAATPLNNVTFTGRIALAANQSLSVHSTGAISLPNGASKIFTTGTGAISLTTARNISLSTDSEIASTDGAIALSANQQAVPASGDFIGVVVNGGSIRSTGLGDVTLIGRGGDSPTGLQFGVRILAGGQVSGGTSGTLEITGFGGTSTGNSSSGAGVAGVNSLVTSLGANVVVNGTGGTGAAFNRGVVVAGGGQISAGGAGSITVQGTGGIGTLDAAQGVLVDGLFSGIISNSGNVTITGMGGGAGATLSNGGVVTANEGFIRAGGFGNLQITGIAGNPATASLGVNILAGTLLATTAGDITITGTAVNTGEPSVGIFGDIAVNGDLLIVADRLSIGSVGFISAGTRTVSLRPLTFSQPIDLGGTDSATTLGLSDAEFDHITASILDIGDGDSGPITITSDISRLDPTRLNLTSGGAINFATGSVDTAGGILSITPGPSSHVGVANDGIDAAVGLGNALFLAPGSDLAIAINGLTVDAQHHQLNVAGHIVLSDVDLALSGTFAPAVGDSFVIVANDGTDPIIGTFNGLDNGEIFTVPTGPIAGNFRIDYDGGDGNDVVLTAINAAPSFVAGPPVEANDESGPLSIPFATSILVGPPRESSQQPTFLILNNTNEDLFRVLPAIDAAGNLTFRPNFNVAGQALITVVLKDDGGTANGGSDTSSEVVFAIDVAKKRVWYNARLALDVDGDRSRTAGDALDVINFLNEFSTQRVPDDGRPTGPYYDTDGNGTVTANDALEVINFLNEFGADETPPVVPIPLPETASALQPLSDDLLALLAADLSTQPKRRR